MNDEDFIDDENLIDDDDLEFTEHYCDIPEILYNEKTKSPHTHCKNCGLDLLKDDTPYFIEKAFQDGRALFDYAMCLSCYSQMGEELLSKESKESIHRFFHERVDFFKRRDLFTEKFGTDLSHWIEYCLLTAKPIAECSEYQLAAQCEGDQLLFYYMPFAISDEGVDEIMSVLSEKTKENLKDFTESLIDDPQLKKDKPRYPVLI